MRMRDHDVIARMNISGSRPVETRRSRADQFVVIRSRMPAGEIGRCVAKRW